MKKYSAGPVHNTRGNFEQFYSDSADLGSGKFSIFQEFSAKCFYQYVSSSGEEHSELVGVKLMATGSVTEQIKLLFLDTIFHVAALAVYIIIEMLWFAGKVGYDKSSICSLHKMYGNGLYDGVIKQCLMIIEVFIACGDSAYSLPKHLEYAVFDISGMSIVNDALCQPFC